MNYGSVSLFNGISIFFVYLMPKRPVKKTSRGTIQHIPEGNKGFQSFPKGTRQKVTLIALLEFELANYDVAVQNVRHYTRRLPLI